MKRRITVKLLCALLALVFVLPGGYSAFAYDSQGTSAFEAETAPQAAGTGRYSFYVTYHQTEARTVLSMINSLRTSGSAWYWNSDNRTKTQCGVLGALAYDYELEKAAMQRAAEIIAVFDHSRPNGDEKPFVLYSFTSAGENIAYGYTTAQSVQDGWAEEGEDYDGQGHRRIMLDDSFTAVGVACAEYNGRKYWVQEFRSPRSNAAATAANDLSTLVSVDILDKYIAEKSALTAAKTVYNLAAGDSAALPSVTQTIKMAVSPNNTIQTVRTCTFTSSDASVAKVQGGRIVAVGEGRATLTGKGTGSESVRITVNVTQSGNPPVVTPEDAGVEIKNYTARRTEKKGTLLYLTAEVKNAPANSHIEWDVNYADGSRKKIETAPGGKAEIQVSSDLTVTAVLADSSSVIAVSKTETVETEKGFFAVLTYIIRLIFGITPKVTQ